MALLRLRAQGPIRGRALHNIETLFESIVKSVSKTFYEKCAVGIGKFELCHTLI